MEEFIFGTFATDDLKLVYHRAARSGLQHAYLISPRDPQPGEPVTLTVHLGPETPADHVACYYTLDGSDPAGARGEATNGAAALLSRVAVEWDTLRWGYLSRWEAALPAQPEGTMVRYRIGAWQDGGEELRADWPAVKPVLERSAQAFFRGQPLPGAALAGDPGAGEVFTYRVDELAPPQWAREAVIYHIFVDRFHPGEGRRWKQTRDLRAVVGGTLWGVAQKLDYIAELGATAIWLSPVFPSPTVHGYDATDTFQVEARLGGGEALRAAVEAAHNRGLRVILDLVANHVSDRHPYFVDALHDPASPYRDWFTFDDSEVGYRTFFGVGSMPQVNLAAPGARVWMLDVARYWLREFDIDGYRLDHAHGPGPGFWPEFWAACKAENPECFAFGEIVEPPERVRLYTGRLDGALDFHLADAFRRTFARGTWTRADFDTFVERHLAYFDHPDFLLPTFLDNHDIDRFLFVAGNDKDALREAAAVQMALPGPPVIYYGTEVGMLQAAGRASSVGLEASRGPMWWGDEQDRDLLAFYKRLIAERKRARPWAER